MVTAANLFWIVQLFVVFCAQGQPMQGGTKQRYPYASSLNSGNDHFKGASPELYSKAEFKRSQGMARGGKPMHGDPLAYNMGIRATDQNKRSTCQNSGVAPRAAPSITDHHQNSGVARRASVPMSEHHQATFYQPEEQQVNSYVDRNCDPVPNAFAEEDETEQRRQDLRSLVQHLYVAQARVQLEATEIRKAQAVASSAQAQLEDSANQVRSVTASLHTAQQEVAASAIRAQIAQLQLAAHDQLLFAARQDVDALSSQMVGLQAAEGIVQPKLTVDLHALLDKLKQPLQQNDHPTPVPAIAGYIPGLASYQQQQQQQQHQQPQQWQGHGQGQSSGQWIAS